MPDKLKYLVKSYDDIRDFRMLRLRGITLGDLPMVAKRWISYQFLPHYFGGPPRWRVLVRSLNKNRVMPDFALVGPIKSGSSDLASYVLQHPCILPPLTKELHTANVAEWPAHYPTVREKERVAARHGQAITGYFATALHTAGILEALHGVRPNAKIIILLRDPVHRAFSHYKWELLLGGSGARQSAPYLESFSSYVSAALASYPTPLPSTIARPGDPHTLLESGIYTGAVRRWMDRFGKDRVLIVKAETFFSEPRVALARIHDFLSLPRVEPQPLTSIVNRNDLRVAPMDDSTQRKLTEFYRPHNEQLYELIGERLDWLS